MWILPALVGPTATVGLEHLIGWRWTLLVPVPVVLAGRLLVARAVHTPEADPEPRPFSRMLLVPVGVAGIVLGGALGNAGWPLAVAGGVLALIGGTAILPPGTVRLARGAPAALAAMTLFAVGYFGADGLVTVLLTDRFGVTLGRAGVVLSSAPLAWALTSLAVARVRRPTVRDRLPAVGLAVSTLGAGTVALGAAVAPSFAVALTGWALAGVGVGLAYPVLYVLATTPSPRSPDAAALATAVITAEALGSVLGTGAGGAIGSISDAGLAIAYLVFTATLGAAAWAATRALPSGRMSACSSG
jgi:MFS family permease